MSRCLTTAWVGAYCTRVPGLKRSRNAVFADPHQGVGMLEFLIALLIFSTAMAGLLSVQLAGKKASHKAAQRLMAVHLGRDILERIKSNPGEIAAYGVTNVGNLANRLPLPGVDCRHAACGTGQLAVFDLWQWEGSLIGDSEQYFGVSVGGLVSPRACIANAAGHVTVSISWLDRTADARPVCGIDVDIGAETAGEIEDNQRRRQLTLTTFVAAR